MRNKDIFSLIDDDIDKAFEVLDNIFFGKNATYKDLSKEYFEQPNNFSLASFRSKLKRFVNTYNNEGSYRKSENDYYELLCNIELEPHSTFFKNVYSMNEHISAVFLYGDDENVHCDLKWLYNQLLLKEGFIDSPPIIIDFSSNSLNCFNDFFNVLCERFGVDIDSKRKKPEIINKINRTLEASKLLILIKYPKGTSELKEFFDHFYDNYSTFHDLIINHEKNSLVFMLIEDDIRGYEEINDEYFLKYNQETEIDYIRKIIDCVDSKHKKIVDLSPMRELEVQVITDWVTKHSSFPEIRCSLFKEIDNIANIFTDKKTCYNVIKQICIYSKITIEEKWMPY